MAAYIYKENSSTVITQRTQLNFIHMVQDPLTINAKPFYVLDFDIFVNVSEDFMFTFPIASYCHL